MPTSIDWSAFKQGPNLGTAFQAGYDRSQMRGSLDALARDPTDRGALAKLYTLDPAAAARMEMVNFQRAEQQQKQAATTRQAQARAIVPDVLAGVGLGGTLAGSAAPNALAGAQTPASPSGDIVVEAPRPHKTIADVYALDPELAGHLATQIGTMHDDHRKQLGSQADTLAVAAFAARQAPYAKRRDIIDAYRRQLGDAGFSAGEIDDFDPTDEALNLAITHSLGIKGALSQQLDQQKFAWQQRDDQIDNARDDRRVAIQDRGQRDASARGWSADRRAERRYKRGDGVAGNLGNLASDDLINMLEQR